MELIAAAEAGVSAVYGLTPSFAALVVARLRGATPAGGTVVVVTPDEAAARHLASDLEFFLPHLEVDDPAAPPRVLRVPGVDSSPYAELSPDRQSAMERMAALFRLSHGEILAAGVVVVSATSMLRLVVPRDELDALTARVRVGEEIDRDELVTLLVRAGFVRCPVVEDAGTFAVRGGVIDVFPPLYRFPARVELLGDEVETIRLFDPQTQRTLREIDSLYVHPVRQTIATGGADVRARVLDAADKAAHPSKATRRVLEALDAGEPFVGIETLTPAFHQRMDPLWSYLPRDPSSRWLVLDPHGCMREAHDELDVAQTRFAERLDDHKIAFAPEQHWCTAEALEDALAAPPHRLDAYALEVLGADTPAGLTLRLGDNLSIRSALERMRRTQADELLTPLVDAIGQWRQDGYRIAIACDSAGRAERLVGLLREYDVHAISRDLEQFDADALPAGAPPTILRGRLSNGFCLATDRLVLLTDDDIFGQRRRRTARSRAAQKRAHEALLGGVGDFSQLNAGDCLVHELHGVGIYKGLAKLPGKAIDFLHLAYADGTLYLPVFRLDLVQRYIGAEGHEPKLDKMGGASWARTRKRVSKNVRALAEGLLQLYAQRAALPGRAFPPPDPMFREFEATFEFEETPDQQRAIDDVLADMERDTPMDRLVCGDVGYGKTEVALRATMTAVLGNAQIALLAPTTVLVEQHYRTMKARFAGWPITVARMSRFQSKKQQLQTLAGLRSGAIDAVVGTHRLLSKDVVFKDLGLLIIDEEQRFGVSHKERLKRIRTQVDVLTLTATPIPRTLHLAMTGVRSLSIIATPPADRRSIRTFVSRDDDGVLRDGIRRELGRGGQVFFVSPRIGEGTRGERSLDEWATHLRELVPDARVAVAHGQMPADRLEKVMIAFVAGKHDILVCTTIIENGIDIPRANTMFVARADSFGLSQLYQLRGRIGRSKHRAFCYLMVPPQGKLTDEARRRLEALQRFTDLGAGFQIASHDLEIRGAGELLGARQSGSIAAVGFDAYTAMLEEAVAELKGEPIVRPTDPELNVDLPAYIPDDYVPDTGQRLSLYKRLSCANDEDEVMSILDEIGDRYGALPTEVALLGDLSIVKLLARQLGAIAVELTDRRLCLTLSDATPLSGETLRDLITRPGSVFRLTRDMRMVCTFSEQERAQPAAQARRRLLDLLACAT